MKSLKAEIEAAAKEAYEALRIRRWRQGFVAVPWAEATEKIREDWLFLAKHFLTRGEAPVQRTKPAAWRTLAAKL